MLTSTIALEKSLIEKYRDEFAETCCIFLPGFVNKKALQNLMQKLDRTAFLTKLEMDEENKFGKVLFVPQTEPVIFAFHLLMNNQALFAALESITNCKPIGNFTGRIHRSEEGEKHQIEWHGDNSDNRLLAMTLSLGNERYTGGKFQLREKESEKVLREFGQIEAGDAIIFEIAPKLQHRLTLLETGRRTVGVGWFRSEPSFETFTNSYLKPF